MKLIFLVLTFSFAFADEEEHPSPAAKTSGLAVRMKGICPRASDLAHFRTKCANSSTTIWPNKLPTPAIEISEDDFIKVQRQNQILLTELIHNGLYDTKSPEGEEKMKPQFGFDALSAAFAIYENVCPTIPTKFLHSILHLFTHLHWKIAADREELMSVKEQHWILRLLKNCSMAVTPLEYMMDTCRETLIAVENCTEYICTQPAHEFRLRRTDPLVDVVWKVFELVQSACFKHFNESYQMWHSFHIAIADLFVDDIKLRWMNQIEDEHFWKNLLGHNFAVNLINIEKCNEAAISKSKFPFRLRRESLPAKVRLTSEDRRNVTSYKKDASWGK